MNYKKRKKHYICTLSKLLVVMIKPFWEDDEVLDTLAQRRWVVIDDAFDERFIEAMEQAVPWQGAASDLFHRAAIGRQAEQQVIREIRSDFIHWLDRGDTEAVIQYFWQQVDAMMEAFRRAFFLPINYYEGHVAVYPPGAFYKKHLDQFEKTSYRQITLILYLNKDWQEQDGGALRVYEADGSHTEVLPLAGRAVLMQSAEVWHEVLPARRTRKSLTGWFSCLPMEERFLGG